MTIPYEAIIFKAKAEESKYWTRLEHQAAIAAMQGFLLNGMGDNYENIAKFSIEQAHALVEKLKEERK